MKNILEKINESQIDSNTIIGANLNILDLDDTLKVVRVVKEDVLGSEIETIIGTEGTGYPLYNETGGSAYSSELIIKNTNSYTLLVCDMNGGGRRKTIQVYIALTSDQINRVVKNKIILNTIIDAIFDLCNSKKCTIDEVSNTLETIQYNISGDNKNSWAYNLTNLKN